MAQQKSIDGLVTRRSKKASSVSRSTTKKSPAKIKPTTAKPRKSPTKTVKKPVKAPATPIINATEDFLKPVQAFNFNEKNGKLEEVKTTKAKKMKKLKKQPSKKRKIITRIAIGLLSLLLIAAIIFVIWGNDIIAKITGGQGNVFDLIFQDEHYEPLKTDENGRTNILAFGTSGYNMDGEENGGIHDGAQLTDSIMIISLDQETGDVALASLPRDLKVTPYCTATGKVNEVYWCNNMDGTNEKAGAEALVKEVGDILDIDFQYYVHVNWGSLVQIVDTLGGITVTVDENIYDYYVFDEGQTYNLNGEQALWLARIRHGTAHGDFSRSASQQKIIIGIKDRLQEKSLSITDMISLASTLGDNLRTNFSIDELKTLAHFSSEYDFNNIRQISFLEPEPLMTTGYINGISYVIPVGGAGYYTNIQKYLAKMFSSDPRDYEDPSILVLNATETAGVASAEKTRLETDGYTNITIDDAPSGEHNEGIILYSLTDKPGTKKLLEKFYNTSSKDTSELPSGISKDYDFVIIINQES